MLSKVRPEQFFELLEKYDSLKLGENIISFPLEYYLGETSIFLYKQIESKTYCTKIIIIPVAQGEEEVKLTIYFKGEQISLEQFISELTTNYKAIELVEEINKQEIKLNIGLDK